MGLVCGVGIYDIRGWYSRASRRAKDLKYRVFNLWKAMLTRCYSNHESHKKWYDGCSVCERWLTFSNFVKDIKELDGYEQWETAKPFEYVLDKDIICEGNKLYSPSTCKFVSSHDSMLDVAKRNHEKIYNTESMKQRVVSYSHKVICTDGNGQETEYMSVRDAARVGGFNRSCIMAVCKGIKKTHHGCKFRYA